jgi:tetratricopeptide (TPR) repeat protein
MALRLLTNTRSTTLRYEHSFASALTYKPVIGGLRSLILVALLSLLLSAQAAADQGLTATLDRALEGGQTERARQLVTEILAQPHIDLDVLLETGEKLASRELFELARTVFDRGVSDYPQSFEARYNLALSDFALRKFSEAQKVLDHSEHLSREQQLMRAYLHGKIYDAVGQKDLAEASLLAAFQGAPQQENYALDLGLHYLQQHNWTKALTTLQAASKYHPDSVYVELELGLAQALGEDPSRAVATCRKILAKEPGFVQAQLLLATAYYLNGDNQKCATEAAGAIRQPNTPPYLFYLHAASLLKLNSNEYPVMLNDLDKASRQIPACSFCYFAQSKVHQKMGDEGAAIADLETLVTRVDPEFAQGWYRLSNLYRQAGRPDDAAKALAKFRNINGEHDAEEMEYLRKVLLSALGTE